MILKSAALAAALVLTTMPVHAQTDVSPPTAEQRDTATTSAAAFGERVASSNQFEIMSSDLAMQKSQNTDVQGFAKKMIADHTVAGEKFVAAADQMGVIPAPALMVDHQAQYDSLNMLAGEEFDQAYLGAQIAAHTEAVDLFAGYADRGEEGPLKIFAAETLPTLQAHLKEIQVLSSH